MATPRTTHSAHVLDAVILAFVVLFVGAFLGVNAEAAHADEHAGEHADEIVLPASPGSYQDFTMTDLAMVEEYDLGVEKYQLDHKTRITGWQVSDHWFFGHQRGKDSGFTLVWQKENGQVSFSKDGVRFTRRF